MTFTPEEGAQIFFLAWSITARFRQDHSFGRGSLTSVPSRDEKAHGTCAPAQDRQRKSTE
jgi:hypothetical protein